MALPEFFDQLGAALSLFRSALGLVKDVKDVLPAPQQEVIGKTIQQAENAAKLAEAQIAQSLGYPLHRCTFPPQIMLARPLEVGERYTCPACGRIEDRGVPRTLRPPRRGY